MPILLPPQRSRLDRLSSMIPDPFISTYLFNSCHSLNPFFHHYSSIRNATGFNLSTILISFLVTLSIRRHSLQLPLLPIVNQPPWLYLFQDDPSSSYSISSPCTLLMSRAE